MPSQKSKKKKTTPPHIRESIDKKVEAIPRVRQDRFGYVSDFLHNLRTNTNRTREQQHQLDQIESARQEQKPNLVQVDTPVLTQPTGQPQLAFRNRNPGNIKYRGQSTAILGDAEFAQFDNPEMGIRELERYIRLDRVRNLTLEEFIYKYAPPESENNTESYINSAAIRLGINRNAPILYVKTEDLVQFIAHRESNTKITYAPNP
jgi:hypothetical protein